MRIQCFEFEDISWFPDVIRRSMLDYLRYLFGTLNFYKTVIPVVKEGIAHTGDNTLIDLCSGGGGAIGQLQKDFSKLGMGDVKIILSDKYPNIEAYQYVKEKSEEKVDYSAKPVDATNVPESIKGFRIMFSAFHHFRPEKAKAILQDAVNKNAGIAIFDGGDKNIFTILGIIFIHPVLFLLFTPFFRPFRFSRLFFTYIIPLIPICTVWDGVISILRLYSPKEMLSLAMETSPDHYEWRSGKLKSSFGMHVSYLIGYPKK